MKNYINTRIQAHNHQKTINSIKHNLRIIASLSDEQNTQDIDNLIYYNTNNLTNDYSLETINNSNKNDIYNVINDSYKLYRKAHNEIYKKWNDNKNIRDRKSTWAEGVLTFSEKLKFDYEKGNITKEQLMKVAIECVEEITKEYGEGAKINYIVLHLQETTPHFHFSFNNFNEKGNSLTHINRDTNFLSNLQDIAFKHFNKAFKMDRGVKKDTSLGNTLNYKTIEKFHRENITQLKDDTKKLELSFELLKSIVEAKTKEYDKKYDLYLADTKKLDSKIEELSLKQEEANNEVKSLENEIKLNKQQKEEIKKDTSIDAATRKKMYQHIDKCNKITRAQRDVALKRKNKYREEISTYKEKSIELSNELLAIEKELKNKKYLLEQARKQEQAYFNVNNDYSKFNFSEKIEKLKNIYLKNAPLFGLFNNKQYYEDMQEELGELLTFPKRLENLKQTLEIKNKQLDNYANERENLIKLSETIDKKDSEIHKQNMKIILQNNQLQNFINDNYDLRTKKDNLELVVASLIKKIAHNEIKEIYENLDNSDFRTLSIENNERTLSSEELSLSIDSLDINDNLKQAITKHIQKHK
ncbi:hypothetical protein ACOTWR_05505 [Aliarcobacter butzleri]